MELTALLAELVDKKGSDLFVSYNAKPLMNVEGEMLPLASEALDSETTQRLIYSILSDRDIATFEQTLELNKSLHLPNIGRFRVNVFRQRGEPSLVARYIKDTIPSIEQLGLPSSLKEIVMEERGLILVVGGTGTGKSTTLASMIDYRNAQRSGHILTIEDPIEFMYENKLSLVNQREVGMDTLTFDAALKNALREAPDVILIGEIRDQQTMKQAISYAETGHLCLATLHANNANQALGRIVNFFPEDAHKQLLQDLSLNLKAVISQRLCQGYNDKRVPAVERMVTTPFIADLIDKGRLDEIKEAMERSKGRACNTFDQALFDLVEQERITEEEALRQADSRNNLALRFRLGSEGISKGYPIKSEFTINKTAPFDQYETFRVSPMKVEFRDEKDEGMVNEAIAYGLKVKGLREVSGQADVQVQYALGIKSTTGLGLEPVADEGESFAQYKPETEEHAMLVINIIDSRSRKPVYRLTASRRLSDHRYEQDGLNRQFEKLLSSFPVNR